MSTNPETVARGHASFAQQSRMRKFIYSGLIVGLLGVTLALRTFAIEPRATELELREESLGEVELTGSALRLTLTGSRGIAVCYLWVVANNMQKRHEWNELELVVNSIIKLQPHFIEPWLFQSWNLAYNVSVEADHPRDKYFYIARGIELLAEGQRRNRDVPDLRKEMGFYYQNKLGISDENNYFRCLFQMSCMDPKERDPQRFWKVVEGRREVNLTEFRDFCEKHPILVRRLHDRLGKDQPYKVVEFLEENQRLPSLFEEKPPASNVAQTPKKPPERRFPILPPPSRFDKTELTNDSDVGDDFDNFLCSRAWMTYAQDPYEDPKMRRAPRRPALLIFLGFPARAQAYYAERIEKEGWFDEEGWPISDWFPGMPAVGRGRFWAGEAWARAADMYQDHGTRHGLYKTPEELSGLKSDRERADYDYGLRLTNFNHFYYEAQVERTREAVNARKYFFLANRARGTPRKAIELYRHPAAFGPPSSWFPDPSKPRDQWKPAGWKKIMAEHDEFRNDQTVQEETYEQELKYLTLERELRDGLNEQLKWLVVIQSSTPPLAGGTVATSPLFAAGLLAGDIAVPFRGPLDGMDGIEGKGEAYIGKAAIQTVTERLKALGVGRRPAPTGEKPQPPQ